ncbi:alpha/beta hydrolase [Polymorphospora sp. NPDC051019]|uniref:alpha/beta fold hydrolase n=1 Tax=Polymorphospora sp. NPDC051019 TaxID=3155725 RepID=UPI003421411E
MTAGKGFDMATAGVTSHFLEVPGARLHYDVRGTGPLLVLNGVPMGTKGFAAMAPLLADDYTVVTYDPRGMFRSTVEDPAQETTPELLADDLHRLVANLDAGPAHLFGSSGGAVTGLALVARHPDQVRTFVAHEPPLAELLADREQLRAATGEVCEVYVNDGREAALKRYTVMTGIDRFSQPPRHLQSTAEFTEPVDVRAVLDRFFRHLLRPTACYRPDLAALRSASTRIVVAAGTTSRGQLAHRAAVALAAELAVPLVDFPGDHTGFQSEPEAFADGLRRVLSATP